MRDLMVGIAVVMIAILCFFNSSTFSQTENEQPKEKGKLEIWFRITTTPMTDREIYYQVCKLYIDNKESGEGPFVNKENKWVKIFSPDLDEGVYDIKVLHGYANKEGKWSGELNKQPKLFRVDIKKGPATIIKYTYNIGLLKDDYIYDKLPPTPPQKLPKLSPKNKPRIMVIIPENYVNRYIPDPAAETEVIRKFVENDFWVVDQARVSEIRYNEESKKASEGDNGIAQSIGKKFDIEILIIGQAISQSPNLALSGTYQCSSRVEARAIKVDTGQILATNGFIETANDISTEIASKKSLTEAGNKMGIYLINEIAKKWSSKPAPSVRIKINKVDFKKLVVFEQMLINKVDGVHGFQRRNFDVAGESAEIDADVVDGAQKLSTQLATKSFPEFDVEVINFTANTIDLNLKPKQAIQSDIAIRPKAIIFIEQTLPSSTDVMKIKIMVSKAEETSLEYNWEIYTPVGSSFSGAYTIESFDKSHEYEAGWNMKGENALKGTYPWVSIEVLRELNDNGFTNIVIDKSVRKDKIVMSKFKNTIIFSVDVNGKKTDLKAMEVTTDKDDKLIILDDPKNPLVLSADVKDRSKSKVTAIYVPGYKVQTTEGMPK
ncbi:MAG: hypothetical protein AAB116_11085 [Candidatus Poribacteria bacterium]